MKNKYSIFLLVLLTFVFKTTAQKVNQMDASGQRTGYWTKNYPSGNLRYTGNFQNGKEVGLFKFYPNTSGNNYPIVTRDYSKEPGYAIVKHYMRDGKLKAEGKMIGKNRVGEWKFFFKSGKLLSLENYRDNKLNGLCINYYPNGKKTNEIYYLNGVKNGSSKTYSDEGILIEKINYSNGIYNGPSEVYDLKGNLIEKGTYYQGKKGKDWTYFDADGGSSNVRKKNKIEVKKIIEMKKQKKVDPIEK